MINAIYQVVKRSQVKRATFSGLVCKSFSNQRERYNETSNDDDLDIFNVGEFHKNHLSEISAMKEQEKYHIVQRKYFNEKSPNFLTWADKQQIKYLHASNPEEWTIERLSDGFPALPDTIKKIISSNWSPKNANRILRHDETVQRNWADFKEGHFKDALQEELEIHLRKFTTRELIIQTDSLCKADEGVAHNLVQRKGEFAAIIQSYEMLKQGRSNPKLANKITSLAKPLDCIQNSETNNCKSTEKSKPKDLFPHKEKTSIEPSKHPDAQLIATSKPEKYPNLMYPEYIAIPKDLYKRGATYKLEDCYYDSDGEFLYRVPGLR